MDLALVSLFLDGAEGSIKVNGGTSWSNNQVMTVTTRDGGICQIHPAVSEALQTVEGLGHITKCFLTVQLWRVIIPVSGLEGYNFPLLTVIGPMPLILTCYGLIETASSILICHLAAAAPSGDKELSVTHSHTPSKVPFRTRSHGFLHGVSSSSGMLIHFYSIPL